MNLAAIETSLTAVQQQFSSIERSLNAEREAFRDEVLRNLLDGYGLVDTFVSIGIDLFALGNSRRILELNNVVLYGNDGPSRGKRYRPQIEASEQYFYDQEGGGIGDLIEFFQRQRHRDAWNLAALIYIRMLAQPQLFIEGNHRTGALVMSYILLRNGLPPFVLTPENAKAYFDPSAAIGRMRKRSVAMRLKGWRLTRHFVGLLKDSADTRYLLSPSLADLSRVSGEAG